MTEHYCPICGAKHGATGDATTDATTGASDSDARVFDLSSKTQRPRTSPKKAYEDPWFQQFWEVYPRRVGKKPAWNAWQKCIKNGASPAAIVEAATAYAYVAKRKGVEAQFIKYPQGWLNDERFHDEPEDIKFEAPAAQITGTPEWEAERQAEYERIQREWA